MDNNDAQPTNAQDQMFTDEELNNMSEDELLDVYVSQLIFDKGLKDLNDDLLREVHKDIKERLVFQINRAMVAALPDDKLDELNKMLDEGRADAENVSQLVNDAGIDAEKITEETMKKFREVYLSEDAAEADDNTEE